MGRAGRWMGGGRKEEGLIKWYERKRRRGDSRAIGRSILDHCWSLRWSVKFILSSDTRRLKCIQNERGFPSFFLPLFFPFSSFFAHDCPFKQRRGSIRWIVSCQTVRRQLRRKGYLGRRKGKNANAISALDSIFLRDLSFLFFSSSSFFSRVIRFMAAQRGLDLELERVL